MKKFQYSRLMLSALGVIVLSSGCATGPGLEKQIAGLERQILRLQAEKAQLAARNAELDDKLVRQEAKASKVVRKKTDKNLRVVRLGPEELAEKQTEMTQAVAPSYEPRLIDANKERPVLTLRERPARTRQPLSRVAHTGDSSFGGFDGDNLGVVKGTSSSQTAKTLAAAPSSANDPMEQFQLAYRAYSNKKYDDAIAAFDSFLRANPTHRYADNALYWKGESLSAKGKVFKAIGEYERILIRYPKSDKAASATYRIGFSYDQMHDMAKAKEYYFKVVEKYPGTDAARRASQRVAVLDDGGTLKQPILNTSAQR